MEGASPTLIYIFRRAPSQHVATNTTTLLIVYGALILMQLNMIASVESLGSAGRETWVLGI